MPVDWKNLSQLTPSKTSKKKKKGKFIRPGHPKQCKINSSKMTKNNGTCGTYYLCNSAGKIGCVAVGTS